jgi:uncharacterized repeat protein (TIGR03803 family)
MFPSRIGQLVATVGFLAFALVLLPIGTFAQSTERMLYAFEGDPNCAGGPLAPLVSDAQGDLYGTTYSGGADNNNGCIFKLSPSGSGWSETVLHSFNSTDGWQPIAALVFDKSGNLYGTAYGGGAFGGGVAYELSPSSNGEWTETILHNFGGANRTDGHGAGSNLIFDGEGNLYGTTVYALGQRQGGTVYKLSPGPNGWTETILYTFPDSGSGPDGDGPAGGVVMDCEGNLYGVTQGGGANGLGAVYQLSLQKDGQFKESVIHSFDRNDGAQPLSGLTIDRNGILYGTTDVGGDLNLNHQLGVGAVFRVKKDAAGNWTEDVLHQMIGSDGASPHGPVTFDNLGNLYAVASSGGIWGIYGQGSVFELSPTPSGPWNETVLHLFDDTYQSGKDGRGPYGGVIIIRGQLFGTTAGGGAHNAGIVFELTPPAQ